MCQASDKSRLVRNAVFAVGLVATVIILGDTATQPNLSPWFSGLIKPRFYPPNWIFGPVWTLLYALMAVALWRILRLPGSNARTAALFLFFLQLALNAAWSWMFFWAHSPLLGLINIVPQMLVIAVTAVFFARLDQFAGWCLAPLLAWVTLPVFLIFRFGG